jgi:TPP-dependent pyruvate/acetoin dehydrogenase alpha subunit
VATYARRLLQEGAVTEAELSAMDNAIRAEVADAFAFAESAPFPAPATAAEDVHATGASA